MADRERHHSSVTFSTVTEHEDVVVEGPENEDEPEVDRWEKLPKHLRAAESNAIPRHQ